MTELQEKEFGLLKELDRVCRRLRIPYFLVCGSALGAVKYGGFIPWDDDIDVAMYREDYDRFCREAQALLPEHLFLQNFRTEPAFPQIFSKLRNSETTYIETTAAKLPINHGIFLDIFPLDGYPRGRAAGKLLELGKRLCGSILLSAYELPEGGPRRLWRLLKLHRRTRTVAGILDRLVRRYPVSGSELVCNHGNWQGVLDYAPVSWFGAGTEKEFEGLKVLVPVCFDEYLRRKYGDYEQDPPAGQQKGHHYCDVCDCRTSYRNHWNSGGNK